MASRNSGPPGPRDTPGRNPYRRRDQPSSFMERGGALGDGETSAQLGRSVPIRQYDSCADLRQRITPALADLAEYDNPNSFKSFTRSWQRAAGFPEVFPHRQSFVLAPDAPHADPITHEDDASNPPMTFLRQHISTTSLPECGVREDSPDRGSSRFPPAWRPQVSTEQKGLEERADDLALLSGTESHNTYTSIGEYGTMASNRMRRSESAGNLWIGENNARELEGHGETEPILVKGVEQEDGTIVLRVEGQSTLPQTIFNSINVLIGIGLLSLPMGMRYAGWLCGVIIIVFCALLTSWTAKLLAKCMDVSPSIITFSDLAYVSFGPRARIATSFLFSIELVSAVVAQIILFADSLDLLFPGLLSVLGWKIVCTCIMIPLNFMPLRLLSFTSMIGIFCCLSIVLMLFIDGFIKPSSPGSLLEPAVTYLFPKNWLTLPLSFGLLMSPWGGHGVFPNIYRDMRHPRKYARAVNISYIFTFLLDASTAFAGLLMFGDEVADEITSNILRTSGYPRLLKFLMVAFIAVMLLTKIPLTARPIISTVEVLTGLHQSSVAESLSLVSCSSTCRSYTKIALRIVLSLAFLAIAVIFPAFESILAFMGSALCFTICVILPLAFYLQLFGKEISGGERLTAYSAIIVSICLSITGTVFAFLPKCLVHGQ